jgi:hypothetical protein
MISVTIVSVGCRARSEWMGQYYNDAEESGGRGNSTFKIFVDHDAASSWSLCRPIISMLIPIAPGAEHDFPMRWTLINDSPGKYYCVRMLLNERSRQSLLDLITEEHEQRRERRQDVPRLP